MKTIAAFLSLLLCTTASAQQPKFEIADVHASPTLRTFAQNFGGVLREGRYVNRDATLLNLITAAYDAPEDTISGGPGWIASDLFDVIAKVPDGTTPASANLMLRSLLSERFGLVIKTGTSPAPRFVLTVAKGGSKLKSAAGTGNPSCQPQQQAPGNPADPASMPNIKVFCRNMTAAAIADNLRQMAGGYLDHDLIDSTKLDGTYDFDIEWTGRGNLAAKGADGISIFDAVEKQLGLKLQSQNLPVPSLIIEKVNRKPTPNPEGLGTSLALAEARFEAASVKLANPDDRPFNGVLYTGGSQMRAGGTLRGLIALSLQIMPNIADDMVLGVPKSADTQRWDINAKVPSTGEGAPHIVKGRAQPPPFSVALEMLRGVMIDQFGLKFHTENREVTVYALTTGSGKPKMTKAADTERAGCKPDPDAPKPASNIQVMISCKNTSMAELAQNLQQMASAYIDHPIIDATGLQDGWNFLIGWTPKAQLQPTPSPSPSPSTAPAPIGPAAAPNQRAGAGLTADIAAPNGISAFEAVEKELGLKLVKQKRSIPVIVVDHVNEKPAE